MDDFELIAALQVVADMEEAENDAEHTVRQFRQSEDPFQLSNPNFIKFFRVSKELAHYIVDLIAPFVTQPTRASALTVERKVLIALRFLGFGSYQEITGTNIFTAVSQSTVSKCLEEICSALCNPLILNEWVSFPCNMRELQNLRDKFYEKYHFPGIVGCVDCTHVAITKPKVNDADRPEYVYVNRKNYHSINVQLICDHNLKILNVNAKFPGSVHDAHIWRESVVSQGMEAIYRRNPNNAFYLIGDSGYPLRPWLLTPIRQVEQNSPEQRFNHALTSIRSLIERCNGVLKNRFRCLLKDRVLHYAPVKAAKIINACVIMHNMCIHFNVPEPDEDDNLSGLLGIYEYTDAEVDAAVNSDLIVARELQREIIRNHFS